MSEDLAHYVYQKWFEITGEDENDFLYPKDEDSKEAMKWIFKNTKYKNAEEFKSGLIEEIRKRIVDKIEVKGIKEYY